MLSGQNYRGELDRAANQRAAYGGRRIIKSVAGVAGCVAGAPKRTWSTRSPSLPVKSGVGQTLKIMNRNTSDHIISYHDVAGMVSFKAQQVNS